MMGGKGTEEFQKLENEYANYLFGGIQCMNCKYAKDGRECEAFDWIPDEILTGEHDHRNPYPGDKGIRFEPKSD